MPRLTRLQTGVMRELRRNAFVMISDGIGGRFTEILKFVDNKWLEALYRKSAARQSVLLRGFPESANQTAEEATPAANNEDEGEEEYEYDYELDESEGKRYSILSFIVVLFSSNCFLCAENAQ